MGSVIPTRGAIIPAAVGVDIGCGMCAVRTVLTANDRPILSARFVRRSNAAFRSDFRARQAGARSEGLFGIALKRKGDDLYDRYQRLRIMDRVGKFDHKRVWNQVGTLGGGNHFVELCLDESNAVWIMLLRFAQRRQDDRRNRDRHGARDGRQAPPPSAGP